MLPDTVYNALDKILPKLVPAEGAGTLCNFQMSIRPRTDQQAPGQAVRAEVLTFNSGGAGARPSLDGMSATAFPSGVMTMPVEATEHVGPVVIWRKELRPDSGGAGEYRGGLGQYMEVSATEGHEFDFSAMFDRVHYSARGRNGGHDGAPTVIKRSDGAPMQGKGKQFIPHGQRVLLEFPGGAGYGDVSKRDPKLVARDFVRGYISEQAARDDYALSDLEIEQIKHAIAWGEEV
jgi:N-methylhydantoinase B